MTARKRQVKRTDVAKANGYVSQPVPETPEWAVGRLHEPLDERSAKAALKLRGLTA